MSFKLDFYPRKNSESLTEEIHVLAELISKFYQEQKQEGGKEYSQSAHVAIRAGLNRFLTSN